MSRHTLSVLVEDKPGVLTRFAGLISRRGFNIHSLAVGNTEAAGYSRITVVVDVGEAPLEQVTKQLNKLVNVIKIVELDAATAVRRAHMIFKVKADAATRPQVLAAVEMFRAQIVDVSTESVSVEATGEQAKLDALQTVLEPFGIKEIVQSGTVAIGRGAKSITDKAPRV
ncbi:acetolactate synthase small subunit [Brevibacterium sp. 50QC2O2]|jgi:acetolactate synthase-1/3 small subunit|uniref:acetolactate synthase small subunit n=1 Tax=Brevibacterium TaxID=1696 RepID=UPI00211BEECB|nr:MULTISPECIES: acetolactate synthase small subunit [unclassified Brevibacterium]MCQ9367539.1 acetolactate synthase small subunit [Brevibacterium sp. 91QC2O2]MCQ9386326.1 acetolactate synthase small subunit [Brevibacterium sp. 68QC2CO]MCQ9389461.1 acetolactate synthase small subunit [Brevibacterium sp. 50QC2O2]